MSAERFDAPAVSRIAQRLREYLRRCLRIDTRSLALFRMALALIIIVEVLLRTRNFSVFYTEDGLVPQELATENTVDYAISVYFLTTDSTVIAALMGLQVVIGVFLLVGYRTRTVTVLSLLFMVSLDHHNPLVTSYADTLLRMLLFWAMFLPLGERWSVDAMRGGDDPRPYFIGVASVLALGQMVYMYVRNGLHKRHSEQWTGEVWIGDVLAGNASLTDVSLGSEAAPLVLGRDDITFLLGEYTHHATPLLEVGSVLWFHMMLVAWLLILLPGRYRYPAILLFMGGHFSFAVTVRIGMFPYVAMAGLLLFVPTQFWKDGSRVLARVGVDSGASVRAIQNRLRSAARLPNGHLLEERLRITVYQFVLLFVVLTMVISVSFSGAAMVGLDDHTNEGVEQQLDHMASTLNVDQPTWSIFASNPGTTDRYYVFPARTETGEIVDVYNDRPFDWERPYDRLNEQYGTYRERFYMNSIRRDGGQDEEANIAKRYAEHLCETWEGDDGEQLTHVSMWQVREDFTIETIDSPEDRERNELVMHRFGCGENEWKRLVESP